MQKNKKEAYIQMKKKDAQKELNTKNFAVLVKKIFYGSVLISLVGFVAYALLFLMMYIL